MAGFNGKWKLVYHKDLEAYHDEIGAPDIYKKRLRTILKNVALDIDSYVEELKMDLPGKTIYRTRYENGEKTLELKLAIGSERELIGPDGRPYGGTVTMDGDNKFQVYKKGADFETTHYYDLKGDYLGLFVTSGNGKVTGTNVYVRA